MKFRLIDGAHVCDGLDSLDEGQLREVAQRDGIDLQFATGRAEVLTQIRSTIRASGSHPFKRLASKEPYKEMVYQAVHPNARNGLREGTYPVIDSIVDLEKLFGRTKFQRVAGDERADEIEMLKSRIRDLEAAQFSNVTGPEEAAKGKRREVVGAK